MLAVAAVDDVSSDAAVQFKIVPIANRVSVCLLLNGTSALFRPLVQ